MTIAVSRFDSLHTSRFVLRPLRSDDVTETYSRWFDDPAVAPHILAARENHDVVSLRRYVAQREARADVLFLGVFTAEAGAHIGNIKYEPVDERAGFAVMGILIGDPAWRGRGVAEEVIVASSRWLQECRRIQQILLGVSKSHRAAIVTYEKIGFRIAPSAPISVAPDAHVMVWRLHPRK